MRVSTGVAAGKGGLHKLKGMMGAGSSPFVPQYTAIALAAVVLGLVYAGTLKSIAKIWTDAEAYGHGPLIVVLAMAMLYWDRGRLADVVPRFRAWGPLCMLVLSLAWGVFHFAGVEIFQQLAVYAMLGALVATWYGVKALFATFGFAYGYLLLAIPVWSILVSRMQDATASAAVPVLQWLGVPVFREDRYLAIPSGLFEVAQACAGLRYLLATLAIMGAFAVLNLRLTRNRILLVTLSVVASVAFNWVRVIIVIGVGHLSEMHNPIVRGSGHVAFGWFIFGACMLCLLGLGVWMKRREERQLAIRAPQRFASVSVPGDRVRGGGGAAARGPRALALFVALAVPIALGPLAGRGRERMSPVGAGYVPDFTRLGTLANWRPVPDSALVHASSLLIDSPDSPVDPTQGAPWKPWR
ncbi:MAG: exosortase, partial [Gammaproteobacteria bacterium]